SDRWETLAVDDVEEPLEAAEAERDVGVLLGQLRPHRRDDLATRPGDELPVLANRLRDGKAEVAVERGAPRRKAAVNHQLALQAAREAGHDGSEQAAWSRRRAGGVAGVARAGSPASRGRGRRRRAGGVAGVARAGSPASRGRGRRRRAGARLL